MHLSTVQRYERFIASLNLPLALAHSQLCVPLEYAPVIVPKFQPLTLGRVTQPFSHTDWLFELKFDGFRALVRIEQGKCRMVSRKGNDFKSFRKLNESLLAELGPGLVVSVQPTNSANLQVT